MSRGINKVILVGHLGRDPETRHTPEGLAISTLSLATTEVWKDKQSGEKREQTEWHRVVMYRRLAEIASEYLKKGSTVYIEGKLRTRKWQDKITGADRYSTEINADEMQMLDSKSDASGRASYNAAFSSELQQPPSSLTIDEQFDDDIPF